MQPEEPDTSGTVRQRLCRSMQWAAWGAYALMVAGTTAIVLGIAFTSRVGDIVMFLGLVAAVVGNALFALLPAMRPLATPDSEDETAQRLPGTWRVVSGYAAGLIAGLVCQWLLFGVFGGITNERLLLPIFLAGLVAACVGMLISRSLRTWREATLSTLVLFLVRFAIYSEAIYLMFRIVLRQVLGQAGV